MPGIKFWLHIFLFAVALFLLYILLRGKLIDSEKKVAILVSVMVTLFIISLIELIPELLRWMTEWRKQNQFKLFFGTATFKDKVYLVFAHRVLDSYLGRDPWHTHYKQAEQGNFVPEGVNAWLAFQDVRAAVYLANEIYTVTGRQVKFKHDKDIEEDDFENCAISVGLGFNCFTHHLAGLCDNNLFKIEWGKSPKHPQIETDLFSINGACPVSPKGKDYCIVARIVSRSAPSRPKRVCFVCAGRTAAGTAAAGFFLANDWMKLMKLYKSNKKTLDHDSLVVVVKHTAADESGQLEFDSTGEIEIEQGKPFINWAKASGID